MNPVAEIGDNVIQVRDRRAKYQFSVHNRVVDEWLPVIGLPGFALYSLYCRMANGADERCYPGYSLICGHLGLGRSTLASYNKLLTWCGLLHIESGNSHRSNDYYILDIPEVTPARLAFIQEQAESEGPGEFWQTVVRRVKSWQPLQAHFADKPVRPPVVVGQATMFPGLEPSPVLEHPSPVLEHPSPVLEHPSPVLEHPSPVLEHPSPVLEHEQSEEQSEAEQSERNSQQQQQEAGVAAAVASILANYGVNEPALSELAAAVAPGPARAWGLYIETQSGLQNPAGFLVAQLRARASAPADFVTLAALTNEQWAWLERQEQEGGRYYGRLLRWPEGALVDAEVAALWRRYFGGEQ